MSRRFGRNQRRRAREAIAAAEQNIKKLQWATRMNLELLDLQRRKLRDAEDFQREVAEIVGRQAIIAGEPTSLNLGRTTFKQADGWRVIAPRPLPSIEELMAPTMALEPMRYEVLRLLDIELVADKMRGQMHAWVQIAGAEVCYAMTESAFRGMTDHELMHRLVEPIARQLAMELKRRFR